MFLTLTYMAITQLEPRIAISPCTLGSHSSCYRIAYEKIQVSFLGKRNIPVSGSLTNESLANCLLMKEMVCPEENKEELLCGEQSSNQLMKSLFL